MLHAADGVVIIDAPVEVGNNTMISISFRQVPRAVAADSDLWINLGLNDWILMAMLKAGATATV